jgi:hypothetical protein
MDDISSTCCTAGIPHAGHEFSSAKVRCNVAASCISITSARRVPSRVRCFRAELNSVEADSLAENTKRQALTPLEEFRTFKSMADKGHGEDTIAAAFRVSTLVVHQRMRFANASPLLLEAYEQTELTLEQLMAYCIGSTAELGRLKGTPRMEIIRHHQ